MERYYNVLNGVEKIETCEDSEDYDFNLDGKDVLIALTENGKIIGLLEFLLYSIAIMIKSLGLIAIILAVRSYVSVTSHPNKEEAEFYIIGLLGSLFYSLVFTSLYILFVRVFYDLNLFILLKKFLG